VQKNIKKKIKNITKHYKKMKAGSRKMKRTKRRRMISRTRTRTRTRTFGRSFAGGTRRHKHNKFKGGYSQYQNNQPFSNSYSVGGILPSNELGLANPPPISSITNNAIDNYNHYTNTGFSSRGH
jgi:hypothetical protein